MLIEELPPSRERSLALTKLDEAEMWADRAPVDPSNEDFERDTGISPEGTPIHVERADRG